MLKLAGRVKLVKLEHPLNIESIVLTDDVSKLAGRGKLVKLEHPLNI